MNRTTYDIFFIILETRISQPLRCLCYHCSDNETCISQLLRHTSHNHWNVSLTFLQTQISWLLRLTSLISLIFASLTFFAFCPFLPSFAKRGRGSMRDPLVLLVFFVLRFFLVLLADSVCLTVMSFCLSGLWSFDASVRWSSVPGCGWRGDQGPLRVFSRMLRHRYERDMKDHFFPRKK